MFAPEEDEEAREKAFWQNYYLTLIFFIRHQAFWIFKKLGLSPITFDTTKPYWRGEVSTFTASEITEWIQNGPPEKKEGHEPPSFEFSKLEWSEEGGWVGDYNLPSTLRN